jgi:hypothetical protein
MTMIAPWREGAGRPGDANPATADAGRALAEAELDHVAAAGGPTSGGVGSGGGSGGSSPPGPHRPLC